MSDLFENSEPASRKHLPLAARMRPSTLDDYVGQEDLLGPGQPTREAIVEGTLGSVILWAPPGCGKTTLAYLIAQHRGAAVDVLSAVTAGVSDVRKVVEAARYRRNFNGQATLLLLDEIHHFNKSQQDSLLGVLEDGTIQLVGATTENPFFALNKALLSRARVLPLKPLRPEAIKVLLKRALNDVENGLGARGLTINEDALNHLVNTAEGDARTALSALEAASLIAPLKGTVELEHVEQAMQRKAVRYDRQGDEHYDTISAFIKSVRGSATDAALHYLARMLEAGEDPRFIARRLMILASEDIGNAEPQGIVMAASALSIVERIGMPEARITLAQVTTFLAEAPKSNRAYLAIDKALDDVRKKPIPPIPMHLRNAPHSGMKELGAGEGYQYPHDFPGAWVDADYIDPHAGLSTPYYDPSDRGYEAKMTERRKGRTSRQKQ